MDPSSGSYTSPTLLGRLRQEPADQAAWAQFVERYGRLVHAWCRKGAQQEADAEDVAQMVLVPLAERMRSRVKLEFLSRSAAPTRPRAAAAPRTAAARPPGCAH